MKRKQQSRRHSRHRRPPTRRHGRKNRHAASRTKARAKARRARRALGRVRRGESLSAAVRAEHISVQTALRHVGKYLRRTRTKGGKVKYVPIKSNHRIPMWLLTTVGYVPVSVGSRNASLLGKHSAAVKKFLRTGNASGLAPFVGKRVAGHELVTDPEVLSALADAGALRLDDLYR